MKKLTHKNTIDVAEKAKSLGEATRQGDVLLFENDKTTIELTRTPDGITVALNGKLYGNAAITSRNAYTELNMLFVEPTQEQLTVADGASFADALAAAQGHETTLLKVDFMQLFMLPELTDIEDLQKGDPDASPAIAIDKNVRTAMTLFDNATHVDLTKPVVQSFVGYLSLIDSPNRTGEKVVATARVLEILSGKPPASVI